MGVTTAAMASSKPTLILVPGAFHLHSTFDLLVTELHAAGFSTESRTLKSVNASDMSVIDDIRFLRKDLLRPLVENESKDVIVLTHSYGGVPTCVAIDGLSREERSAKGLEGGIIGLIYLCAILVKDSEPTWKSEKRQWPHWQTPNVRSIYCRMFSFQFPNLDNIACAPPYQLLKQNPLQSLTKLPNQGRQ